MADLIDQANDFATELLQAGINSRQRFEGVSAEHCEECGEVIPEKRRLALRGVKCCVDCAEVHERKVF